MKISTVIYIESHSNRSEDFGTEIFVYALRSFHKLIEEFFISAQNTISQYLAISVRENFVSMMSRILVRISYLVYVLSTSDSLNQPDFQYS